MKPTHRQQILRHLMVYGSITPIEALREYGCMRLAPRIKDLRDAGHPIKTDESKGYATYTLTAPVQAELALTS